MMKGLDVTNSNQHCLRPQNHFLMVFVVTDPNDYTLLLLRNQITQTTGDESQEGEMVVKT